MCTKRCVVCKRMEIEERLGTPYFHMLMHQSTIIVSWALIGNSYLWLNISKKKYNISYNPLVQYSRWGSCEAIATQVCTKITHPKEELMILEVL